MFCTHCGKELKDGSRFCNACGAPVKAGARKPAADTRPEPLPSEPPAPAQTNFANQMESDRQRSRKKLSPLMILVIVLALLAGTAFAAVFFAQQAGQNEQAPQSEPVEPEVELSPEEQAIADLDGWWLSSYHDDSGFLSTFGEIHDGVIDWYRYDRDASDMYYSATVNFTRAERFEENGVSGWRFFTSTSDGDSWAYYEADGDANELPIYKTAFGYGVIDSDSYSMLSPERYGMSRIVDLSVLDRGFGGEREFFARAQELAASRASEEPANSGETFDQAAAEAEARAAAEAAGKQIISGTVEMTTVGERIMKRDPQLADDFGSSSSRVLAILNFDSPQSLSAEAIGSNREVQTRPNQDSISMSDPERWRAFDGQHITIAAAAHDLTYPSDVSGVMFSADGAVTLIAPLTEEDVSAASTSASDGDYILADSATRSYSRSELEKLSNRDLFIARNEIYARHGRKFKSSELQRYFGSKPWYRPTIEADAFADSMLSDIELANARLMLEIETARGSEYI